MPANDEKQKDEKVKIPVEVYPTFEDFARKVITTPKPETKNRKQSSTERRDEPEKSA